MTTLPKHYTSGELLPRLIADAFADLNHFERGGNEASAYEAQIRRVIEAGIDAGAIRKRCSPTFSAAPNNMLFEDCMFSWNEVRAWIKELWKRNGLLYHLGKMTLAEKRRPPDREPNY